MAATRSLVWATALACILPHGAGAQGLVVAHHCPWYNLQGQPHRQRRDFPLKMGFGDTKDDHAQQVACARQAGLDGFVVDCINAPRGQRWTFRALRSLQDAAAATGPGFYVAPCLDRNAAHGADGLVDFMAEALESKDSPAWLKLDGKHVFWTYDAASLPVTEWPKVIQRLEAQGHRVALVCDIGGWARKFPLEKLPTEDLVRWGQVGPVYPFQGDIEALFERIRATLADRGCPGAKLSIGTLRPGYFAVRNGHWFPDLFTRRVREQFAKVRRHDVINVTTWNDYAEDTHFEPSRNKLSCRLDLLHALAAQYKGRAWPAEGQAGQWYLSAPWEARWQDTIETEILGLLPPRFPRCEVDLELLVSGQPAARKQTVLESGAVRAHTFAFQLASQAPERFVQLRVRVRPDAGEPLAWSSAPIVLWPGRYHPSPTRCNIATSPAATLPTGPTVTVESRDAVPHQVIARWPDAPAGARVHVNQNGRMRRICDRTPGPWTYDPDVTYNPRGPRWERFYPVPSGQRWGFFQATGITPDGRVGWGRPVWVEPGGDLAVCGLWAFDEIKGRTTFDAGVYGHHGNFRCEVEGILADSGRRGRCLRLNGKDQYVELLGNISPPGKFTLSAWVRPEGQGRGMIYADVSAPIIFHLEANRTLRLTRRSEERWVSAIGKTPLELDQWTHVAATYDLHQLKVYANGKQDGAAACTGERKSQRIAIGCNPYDMTSFFSGCIDEVRLEARCWPPDRIDQECRGAR